LRYHFEVDTDPETCRHCYADLRRTGRRHFIVEARYRIVPYSERKHGSVGEYWIKGALSMRILVAGSEIRK